MYICTHGQNYRVRAHIFPLEFMLAINLPCKFLALSGLQINHTCSLCNKYLRHLVQLYEQKFYEDRF